MTDYIKHSSCTNFTIYSTCTSTGQAFKFTQSGTESIMYGGTNTGEDLKIQANDADTYPYIKMEGDSHIKLYSSDDIYFYDDATEEFRFYDNSIDIKGDRAIYINDDETYIGHGAGDSITDGVGNTLLGHDAGNDITTGDYNTIIGYEAMDEDADNSNCVCIGAYAGENNTQSNIVAIGYEALEENTGTLSTAVGHQALTANTANGCTALGNEAGKANTSGVETTAVGNRACFSNVDGNYNTALGNYALYSNSSGNGNTSLGHGTLRNTTGNYNTAGGVSSLYANITGTHNTAYGYHTGVSSATNINNCVYIGALAGENNTASSCVMIGYDAGSDNTTANTLYINNSNSAYPLIYGEFDNDVVKIGNNSDDFGLIFDVSTAGTGRIYGGDDTGDNLTIFANSTDTYPYIALVGNGNINIQVPAGQYTNIYEGGTKIFYLGESGGDARIGGSLANSDIAIIPNGTGLVKFGTYAALSGESIAGYITIKDAGGTDRKLAVVA